MANILARRYANVLFQYAAEQKALDTVYRQSSGLLEVIRSSEEFKRFLLNPTISPEKRAQTLKNIFEGKISTDLLKFILFLSSKNRLSLLGSILESFADLYRETQGILRVRITSSSPLSKEQNQSIVKSFEKRFKKEIEAEYTVSPALIGGIKAQVGDDVYDFSLKTQLENFKEKLLAT